VNKTEICFTEEELELLNKGLKYDINYKRKHWLSNLALEADSAITRLPSHEQEHVRHIVAHNLQKLYKQYSKKNSNSNGNGTKEIKIINQIKTKLEDAKAIVTKADKGNSVVIIKEDEYNNKIRTFISKNSFNLSNHDITNK